MLLSSSFMCVLTWGVLAWGTGAELQHLRSRRAAQGWPMGVRGAGRPPVSQVTGENILKASVLN